MKHRPFDLTIATLATIAALVAPALVAGCSAASTNVQSGGDGGPANGNGDGGGAASGQDAGANSDIPGDAPPSGGAPVEVTINGVRRTFAGAATWTRMPTDGGAVIGFQTNAHSQSEWTFVLAVFGSTPGTYSCTGARNGGLSLTNAMRNDGGFRDDATDYGGTDSSEKCTIQLTSYGSRQGDHVTGTFSGELDLSSGDAPVTHLSLTDGKFDLVQFADVPPN